MKPYFESGGTTIYHGDSRELLPLVRGDILITDPVWPNAPAGMFDVDNPLQLFAAAAVHFTKFRKAIIQLGCDSDPRMLQAIPAELPYVRTCWLRYALPSYKGNVLNSGDVAYVFGAGDLPEGRKVLPGEATSTGRLRVWAARAASPDVRPRGSARKARDVHDFGHPCPRDMEHVRWLVANFTKKADVIVDPFCGSGTTLIAAEHLGHPAVGIEVQERYCEVAARRIEDARRQGDLFPRGAA